MPLLVAYWTVTAWYEAFDRLTVKAALADPALPSATDTSPMDRAGCASSLVMVPVAVASALSAALRGLGPRARTVDLVLGDSACAVAVRDDRGAVQAVHLRLLLEGDDRARRSVDEAVRTASAGQEVRAIGEDIDTLRAHAGSSALFAGFDEPALRGSADPQRFPFLALFHERPAR